MQPTNPITEISLPVLSALFVIGACLLLYFGKIDFTGATLMFGIPAALLGVNGAFHAASPAQQAQLAALTTQTLSAQSQAAPTPQAQPFEPPIVPKG